MKAMEHLMKKVKLQEIDVSQLRLVNNVKRLSTEKKEVNAFTEASGPLAFLSFFKKLNKRFSAFFEQKPTIKSIYITNDKKPRNGRNVYFVAITKRGLRYEEEQGNSVVRIQYDFEKDEIRTNRGVIFNVQTRYKFYRKLRQVGKDMANQGAYVFER